MCIRDSFTAGYRYICQRILYKVAISHCLRLCPRHWSSLLDRSACWSLMWHVTGRSRFRSRTRTQLGRRSFHVAAPVAWNSLPARLCSASISRGQYSEMSSKVKTHLFLQAYTSLRTLVLRVYLLTYTYFHSRLIDHPQKTVFLIFFELLKLNCI